ncbi:hypothetical protein [Microlunatus parietis]|uniref:Uncharacterized protein n=1 Tax=Microlunatus parietis TaxID=682979 RepID=A0A7Y9IBU3_9ACTN|nr:hypothetical protein [Microlunatus parietis]NYE73414.1 hypothetical protein [Microlunatus parietis]
MRRRRCSWSIFLILVALVAALTPTVAAASPGERPDRLPDGAFLTAKNGGNTVAATIREAEARADGYRHIDTPAMIKRLKQLNVTMFTYDIWESPTDWDDLVTELVPAAEAAGIDVMVYLVPPSECFLHEKPHVAGRCSRPFELDFVRWAEEIAKLSLKHPNVKSWAIDDFLSGPVNQALFTNEYLTKIENAQTAINPDLKWYVTLYPGEINDHSMERIKGTVDGVIYVYFVYGSTIDPSQVEVGLDQVLSITEKAGKELVLLGYFGRFLDGIVHPDERYVAEVLRRAKPYLLDGRLRGIMAYGAPLDALTQQPGTDYRAHSGMGSLSFSISNNVPTSPGHFAAASQRVAVDAKAAKKTISFKHTDYQEGGDAGYQLKQLLVDEKVVWSQDFTSDTEEVWHDETVDVTDLLAGKGSADVTFRLYHQQGVTFSPNDTRFDVVTAQGIKITNGGFERPGGWRMSRNATQLHPYIDIYSPARPAKIFNAISKGYAELRGTTHTPLAEPTFPGLVISPANRAMTGNGRLSFTIPRGVDVAPNTCAAAAQTMPVDPDSPRYEIDFWHTDPIGGLHGRYFKQLLIDGVNIWNRDVGDGWPWFYLQGSDHQGPIDITDFVRGKEKVKIEYRLCSGSGAVSGLDVLDYKIDNIRTIGLGLKNGGFEDDTGWTLTGSGPVSVAYAN